MFVTLALQYLVQHPEFQHLYYLKLKQKQQQLQQQLQQQQQQQQQYQQQYLYQTINDKPYYQQSYHKIPKFPNKTSSDKNNTDSQYVQSIQHHTYHTAPFWINSVTTGKPDSGMHTTFHSVTNAINVQTTSKPNYSYHIFTSSEASPQVVSQNHLTVGYKGNNMDDTEFTALAQLDACTPMHTEERNSISDYED